MSIKTPLRDDRGEYVLCRVCKTTRVYESIEGPPEEGESCGPCGNKWWRDYGERRRKEEKENASVGQLNCASCKGAGVAYGSPCRSCWWAEVQRLRALVERFEGTRGETFCKVSPP